MCQKCTAVLQWPERNLARYHFIFFRQEIANVIIRKMDKSTRRYQSIFSLDRLQVKCESRGSGCILFSVRALPCRVCD